MELESLSACPLWDSAQLVDVDRAFGFMECSSCGFIFDSPRLTAEAINRHYSRPGQYDGWLDHLEEREGLWRRRLSKLRRHSKPGSLLDVGAGIGQFLDIARHYFKETIGTEISESALSIAKKKYGLELLHGTIDSLDIPTVDNITLFHVLEHVPSPKDTLARCYKLLKPGGRMFICVPNEINSLRSRVDALKGRIYHAALSPKTGLPKCGTTAEIHLSHFTPKTLSFGVSNAGFVVTSLSNDPYYVSSGWRLARNSIWYAIHEAFRLPTYPCTWLVAEKPENPESR